MKKNWILLLSSLLILALAVPALAQTTTIALDGENYTFQGNQPVYAADGKTFRLEGDTVHVLEDGQPAREVPLSQASETDLVEEAASADYAATESDIAFSEEAGAAVLSVGSAVATEYGDVDPVAQYAQYAKYGLSYDVAQNVLYYQGQRVRLFSDTYSLDGNTHCAIEHFDAGGVVDVEALRDLEAIQRNADGSYDPSGQLTGLRALSD